MKYKSPYKGVDTSNVICLATNENSYALPQEIQEKLYEEINFTNRYPKIDNEKLKQLLADRYNVKSENIVIGAGSDELLTLTALKYVDNGENTIMSDPSFFRYKDITELAGGNCKLVKGTNFCHDLEAIKESIDDKTKIVFICNPNNPTGTYISSEEIESFVKSVPENIIVVVDEAYFDFVYPKTNQSSVKLIDNYPNVLVFRTFSKYFGLAGLRIGYAIGNENVIEGINRLRSPYNVSSLAQTAAIEVLKNNGFFDNTYYEEINRERQFYYDAFKEIDIEYIPSQANFIFAKFGDICEEWCEQLKHLNIIIRPCRMFGYPEYVRISIGNHAENMMLVQALNKIIKK